MQARLFDDEEDDSRDEDMCDSVHTVIEEGNAFVDRHGLTGAAAALGGLTWGILRAIMECPNCPGHFRIPAHHYPPGEDWREIKCSNCGSRWVKAK